MEIDTTLLQLSKDLFRVLNTRGVRYCVWKSTCRLSLGMNGLTDLDLLVDRDHQEIFESILSQCGIKRFDSHPSKQYPGLVDYLGFDQEKGKFIHLHVHYKLVLGEQHVKNYDLPIEKTIINHSSNEDGVRIPFPEVEIILLSIRTLLKYRRQDTIFDMLNLRRRSGIPQHILDEYDHLLSKTTIEAIKSTVDVIVPFIPQELIIDFITAIRENRKSVLLFLNYRNQLRDALTSFQRFSQRQARIRYLKAAISSNRLLKYLFHTNLGKRKRPLRGGMMIAFIGSDGAGKTTVVERVADWLSWRMNVHVSYMGSNQPSKGTWIFQRLSRFVQLSAAVMNRIFSERGFLASWFRDLARLSLSLRYIAEGKDRYRRYLEGRQKAAKGWIVLFDRYPMETIRIFDHGLDGSRIREMYAGKMGRSAKVLSRMEEDIYKAILPPDQLYVLQVSPDISSLRKPDHNHRMIQTKCQALRSINTKGLQVTELDADQPLDKILLEVKTSIWDLF